MTSSRLEETDIITVVRKFELLKKKQEARVDVTLASCFSLSLMYDCTVSGPSFIVLYIFLAKFHISFLILTSVFAYVLFVT